MAKTLKQVNAQIARLQREAEALRAKEVKGVVARIREAIEEYGLTAADLGLHKQPAGAKARAPVKRAAKERRKARTRTTAAVAGYRDESGKTWTGRGRAPGWFKAALEAGKTREELQIT